MNIFKGEARALIGECILIYSCSVQLISFEMKSILFQKKLVVVESEL